MKSRRDPSLGGGECYLQVPFHTEGQQVCLKKRCSFGETGKDSNSWVQKSMGVSANRMGRLRGILCGQDWLLTWKSTCHKVTWDA